MGHTFSVITPIWRSLSQIRVITKNVCPRCNSRPESLDHLFFQCYFNIYCLEIYFYNFLCDSIICGKQHFICLNAIKWLPPKRRFWKISFYFCFGLWKGSLIEVSSSLIQFLKVFIILFFAYLVPFKCLFPPMKSLFLWVFIIRWDRETKWIAFCVLVYKKLYYPTKIAEWGSSCIGLVKTTITYSI